MLGEIGSVRSSPTLMYGDSRVCLASPISLSTGTAKGEKYKGE